VNGVCLYGASHSVVKQTLLSAGHTISMLVANNTVGQAMFTLEADRLEQVARTAALPPLPPLAFITVDKVVACAPLCCAVAAGGSQRTPRMPPG
jgi:hypothetical protein